jgi:hypothetical protein
MKYMIEVKEDKVEKLSEHIEKGLHHLGRAMTCVEAMLGQEYNDRGGMNYRDYEKGRYNRMDDGMNERYPHYVNYRDDEWDEDFNERRGGRRRDSMGRYR